MILKGNFDYLTLAIYGDVVSELPPPSTSYTPQPLPQPIPTPLSRSLDPSNSQDPTSLAQNLLELIPDDSGYGPPPQLALVIRLMLCLKPSNEDWDLDGFPYLFANLDIEGKLEDDESEDEFDLDKAWRILGRGVDDSAEDAILDRFVDKIASVIGTNVRLSSPRLFLPTLLTNIKQSIDQSYLVASILSHSASQHPHLITTLTQKLPLESVFDPSTLDDLTLRKLLLASTNPTLASSLSLLSSFSSTLTTLVTSPPVSAHSHLIPPLAQSLATRIEQWSLLTDALTNTQADFYAAASLLRCLCEEGEAAFGVFLSAFMSGHGGVAGKLGSNPIMDGVGERFGAVVRYLLSSSGITVFLRFQVVH